MDNSKTSIHQDAQADLLRLNTSLREADESRKRIDVGHFHFLKSYWSALNSAYRNTKSVLDNKEVSKIMTSLRNDILRQMNDEQVKANALGRGILPTKRMMDDMDKLHELILEQKQDLGLGIIMIKKTKKGAFDL